MFGGRYRAEEQPIGHGGMGVVYKAFDTIAKRFVALKTLRGEVDRSSLELFEREWSVLAQLSHPNIVDVLDIGYYTDNGQQKPYFVMPLLPGCTLNTLIKGVGSRLAVERVVEIVCQACRGLQVAHDRGLVHRDLKPSNLFVMNDDTVKIIDFGIVHLTEAESRTSIRGTLSYMAPEQLELKPASARSDIYSLGVVCYEALTGRKPFERSTDQEIVEAIRFHMPAPVSELNTAINEQVSRAVHKAMAKQPYHRFSSVREFSDILQRSLRNEHIEMFDRTRIQPRINRINRALSESDYQLAIDILDELESEGNIDPEMPLLRMRAEQATRSKAIYQLIQSARTRMEEEEYPLALQNVQRVLDIDPANIDALALKNDIERQRSASQIEKWLQIARQHYDNRLFEKARQAADEVLRIDPSNRPARNLIEQISGSEQEMARLRKGKQQLYDSALTLYRNGEISSALKKLEEVIDLGKRAPGHPNTDAQYLAFYEQVRGERDELHNLYTEGKKAVESRNFAKALDICAKVLDRRPGEPLFKALKIETEDLQRQANSAAIAHLHSQIESEADLDRKFARLKEAAKDFPDEQIFSQSLKVVKERRDLVNSIVSRARQYESQRLFLEASNQWDILHSVYPQYPGLDFEIQRLARKQELHAQEEAKASRVENIDRALSSGDYVRAEDLVRAALTEAPSDGELLQLQQQVAEKARKNREASVLVQESYGLAASGNHLGAITKLRAARALNGKDQSIVSALCSSLVEHARSLAERDWRASLPFVEEALAINSADPGATSVARLLEDVRQREQIERYLTDARQFQAGHELTKALEMVEKGLQEYPGEIRLSQSRNSLRSALDAQNGELRKKSEEPAAPAPRALSASAAAVGTPSVSQASPNLLETSRDQQVKAAQSSFSATSLFSGQRAPDAALNPSESASDNHREPTSPPPVARKLPSLEFRQPRLQEKRRRPKIWKFAAGGAVILLLGAGVVMFMATGKHPSKAVVVEPPRSRPTPQPEQEAPTRTVPTAPQKTKIAESAPQPDDARKAPAPPDRKVSPGFAFNFDSTPSPARVVVDKEPRLTCLTPCSLELSRGPHEVVASSPNYVTEEQMVDVPDQTNLSLSLREQERSIRLVSVPAGATIAVDGEARGLTPVTLQLRLGTHKLAFSKGSLSAEKILEVTPDSFVFTIALVADQSDKAGTAVTSAAGSIEEPH